MPKGRPATSGYARIAQVEEEEEEDPLQYFDDEDPYRVPTTVSTPGAKYAPIQPTRSRGMDTGEAATPTRSRRQSGPLKTRPRRSNSGVDIKAINARLERWADEIASKFKRRRKNKDSDEEQPEIQHSVFVPPDDIKPITMEDLAAYEAEPRTRVSKVEFDDIVEGVRVAIELGTHPKLIAQGSSGSYFARNGDGKVVGVFKPKDEEPYASRNPKWTKWIHRNLFPFFFGRACLIPNLSYISEAAAYVLDTQLRTNVVPYTDIVSLSSKSFHYDFWDRRAYYRKSKPLPDKVGSFQYFLKGYKDATLFLREHPWPDQHGSNLRAGTRKKRRRWTEDCRPSGRAESDDEDDQGVSRPQSSSEERQSRNVFWTDNLQDSFREQLEKLVILDYIMRNTDRGLDNWMIKIDQAKEEATIVAEPRKPSTDTHDALSPAANGHITSEADAYKRQQPMSATSRSTSPSTAVPEMVSLGAIDNSLSWPWKHPDAWRSYPFGWLFLPVSLIGLPFSERTRQHFLPLLTSKKWWAETQFALRRCFTQDADFQEKMYARQIAVMKGQAWNVVETLKTPDHGPLELTRRTRVCVWDDVVDVPVAVPLRVPSPDMQKRAREERNRRKNVDFDEQDEMDISAARDQPETPPRQSQDLLGLGSPSLDQDNRFNVSRHNSSNNVRDSIDSNGPLSPVSMQQVSWSASTNAAPKPFAGSNTKRPAAYHSRMSYEEPRRYQRRQQHSPESRRRRLSLQLRRGSNALSTAFGLGGDDGEEGDEHGDLGYSAAEGRENMMRKVIVERLETVKSKKPFFEWC